MLCPLTACLHVCVHVPRAVDCALFIGCVISVPSSMMIVLEGAVGLSLLLVLRRARRLLLLSVMSKLQNMQCSLWVLPSACCTLVFFVQVMCLLSRMSPAESRSVHAVAS
jgi:hypothetical protein